MSLIKSPSEMEKPTGQIIRYAIIGRYPPVAATVVVAEAFRGAVLSAFHATAGPKDSFLLSGHLIDGKPDDKHRHAYYLPQPDKAGCICQLLVVSPWDRFSPEELIALQAVRALQWNGPSTKISLDLLDSDDQSVIKLASRWVSLTPYVPIRRFWGTHGKHHLTPERQLSMEIARTIPDCVIEEIKLTRWRNINTRVAPRSRTKLPDTPSHRISYTVEFKCRHPVCAPIALGHSSHFGLGQFAPDGKDAS